MHTVETAHVRYVFLDIVAFTKGRSVEAQSDLVAKLNEVVRQALLTTELASDRTILLPTGDGICVALLDVGPFDIHLRTALEILRLVVESNSATSDAMRRFAVRIGINENVDNIVLDINGKRNVAGHGISMAQRIMDKADGGQILVGQTVYETLRVRENYMTCFRSFQARGKHDLVFPVYQFVAKEFPGLDINTPSAFVAKKVEPPKFTKFVAYYVAHAATHREFLLSKTGQSVRNDAATVLLCVLAEDSETKSETPAHEASHMITWKAGVASFEEQYNHYYQIDFWPLVRFAELLAEKHLESYSEYFESSNYTRNFAFVKPSALRKLRVEWPRILEEFRLSIPEDERSAG